MYSHAGIWCGSIIQSYLDRATFGPKVDTLVEYESFLHLSLKGAK